MPRTINGTNGADLLIGHDPFSIIVQIHDGKDIINGFGGNDFLNGRDDRDELYGGENNDHIIGGDGDDILHGDYAYDSHDRNFVTPVDAEDTSMFGDDTLDGGLGADYMFGDLGNDTYFVDNPGDVVEEYDQATEAQFNFDGGIDTVISFPGTAKNGTGNELNNFILGNELDNVLRGEDGNDTIDGGEGSDQLFGDVGDDVLDGRIGDDIELNGGEDSDTLKIIRGSNTKVTKSTLLDGGIDLNGNDTDTLEIEIDGFFKSVLTDRSFSHDNIQHAVREIETYRVVDVNVRNSNSYVIDFDASNISGQLEYYTGVADSNVTGGSGNDSFYVNSTGHSLDGGGGINRIIGIDSFINYVSDTEFGWYNQTVGQLVYQGRLSNVQSAILKGDDQRNFFNVVDYSGDATINAYDGDDTVLLGMGNSIVNAGDGTDTIRLESNSDLTLRRNSTGDIELSGQGGTAVIRSLEKANLITGSGNNRISVDGFRGEIDILAEDGEDVITIAKPSRLQSNSSIDGGDDNDHLTVLSLKDADLSDSSLAFNNSSGALALTLKSIEQATLFGTNGYDSISAFRFSGSVSINTGGGNDELVGGRSDDYLAGTDNFFKGIQEIDLLTGSSGKDTFVLGELDLNSNNENSIIYYNGSLERNGGDLNLDVTSSSDSLLAKADYALLQDFVINEDIVQLAQLGNGTSYQLADFIDSTNGITGTAIYMDVNIPGSGTAAELLGVLQSVPMNQVDLSNPNQFVYV